MELDGDEDIIGPQMDDRINMDDVYIPKNDEKEEGMISDEEENHGRYDGYESEKHGSTKSRSRSSSRSDSKSSNHSKTKNRRSRSRSKSPYAGPIIRDFRRGRRGGFPGNFNRFNRGRRPFRRGGNFSRKRNRLEYSRSHSRSPNRRRGFSRERSYEPEEKSSSHSSPNQEIKSEVNKPAKPADIKKSQKQITQSFLAMLEEKQKRSKMIPIESLRRDSNYERENNAKPHGFVNTFNTVGTPDSQSKHTLSFDLERDGWQVIDDAENEMNKNRCKYEEYDDRKDKPTDTRPPEDGYEEDSDRKKSKKRSRKNSSAAEKTEGSTKKKSRKKRKKSSSSSESEDESEDSTYLEKKSKKKKRKQKKKKKKTKKKRSKKRKHQSSSSSSTSDSTESSDSEDSEEEKKRKKSKKKLKKKKKSKKQKKLKKLDIESKDKKRSKSKSSDKKKKRKSESESTTNEWPAELVRYTTTQPPIQYCANPKFGVDFESEVNMKHGKEVLVTEYERFLNDINPSQEILMENINLEQQLRENLIKQMSDKKEKSKIKGPNEFKQDVDIKSSDYLSQSEKRALEKAKKQQQLRIEEEEAVKRQEELKSVPVSTYYSAKRTISNEGKSENETNSDMIVSDNSEKDQQSFIKSTEEIENTLNEISKEEHIQETKEKVYDFEEDRKLKAKELLDRVKKKKGSNSTGESRKFLTLPVIGKMKKPTKKSVEINGTQPEVAPGEVTKLNMNADYQWYQQYYMTSYGLDPYSASYYAQYSMMTGGDYTQADLGLWMHQQGYMAVPSDSTPQLQQNIPTQAATNSLPKDESETFEVPMDLVENNSESSDQNDQNSLTQKGNKEEPKQIEVIVKNFPTNLKEIHLGQEKNKSPNSSAQTSLNIKTDFIDELIENKENSLPSPGPPPDRPMMTAYELLNPIFLPNGEILPVGTKQIVVHPYPPTHPMYSQFKDEAYSAYCNEHEKGIDSN